MYSFFKTKKSSATRKETNEKKLTEIKRNTAEALQDWWVSLSVQLLSTWKDNQRQIGCLINSRFRLVWSYKIAINLIEIQSADCERQSTVIDYQ